MIVFDPLDQTFAISLNIIDELSLKMIVSIKHLSDVIGYISVFWVGLLQSPLDISPLCIEPSFNQEIPSL